MWRPNPQTRANVMPYVDIVTVLALAQFVVFGIKVGRARARYGVDAPATTGHEVFERHFRVQQNTLEQLVVLIPGLYLFSRYWNPAWAAVLGGIYLVGREIYGANYVKSPARRGLGFGLSAMPTVILIGGAGVGAIRALLAP